MSQPTALRVVPLPLRLLAGVVTAATVAGILLLIRAAPAAAADAWTLVRLAGQAILYLCMAALFGYVAATGLPPSHLWRAAGLAWWPARPAVPLTPDLHRYVVRLRARHPGLRECWHLGPAGSGPPRFLVAAGAPVLDAVRDDLEIRRRDLRLYLLDEATRRITPAWGRATEADLDSWAWEPQADGYAEFCYPAEAGARLAQRLWAGAAD